MGLSRTVRNCHYRLYPHTEKHLSRYSLVYRGMPVYLTLSKPCRCHSVLLVAYHDLVVRGSFDLRLSAMGPQTVIRWGRRLIYVVLFISFLIVYGNFHNPITFTFLGSIVCLIIPVLFLLKDENWTEDDGPEESV